MQVLDSLVIELGLDPKQFVGGQKAVSASLKRMVEDASKEGKDLESQAKKADAFFVSFKRNALELGAQLVGGLGMKTFISNIMQSDAALGRFANRMQIPIGQLSLWENMVKQVGGAAGDATATIAAMERELSNLRVGQGSPELTALAARLGVNLKGGAISATEALEAFHTALERSGTLANDPRLSANILGRLPGMSEGTLQVMLKYGGAFKTIKDAAAAAGVATRESADAAQAYETALTNLNTSADGLGRTLTTVLGPALASVFSGTEKLLNLWRQKKGSPEAQKLEGEMAKELAAKSEALFADIKDRYQSGGVAGLVSDAKRSSNPEIAARQDRVKDAYARGGLWEVGREFGRMWRGEGGPSAGTAPPANVVPVKAGAFSGGESAGVLALAARIARDVPELARFTAGKDAYHAGTGSKHDAGLALDFTIKDAAQSAIVSQSIRNKLTAMGIGGKVLDEYRNPSARSTAPHIHVQFDSPNAAAEYFSRTGVQSGAPAAAAITNITNGGSSSNSSKSSNVNVGPISIYPAGGDAKSVAAGLGGALRQNFAAGLDTSLV